MEIQASISLNLLNQISSSCPRWIRKLVEKKLESRDSRREVSKQSIGLISNSNARIRKTCLIYRLFGRNRPIETINGYDGMVHRGPFQKYCGHWILMDGLDEI